MNSKLIASETSVVITSYNKFENLIEAINSVLDSIYPVKEIIIVDDASSKSCFDYIDNHYSLFIKEKYIKVFPLESNRGANYCRNLGIDKASGEYVALLDDDDRWKENRIKEISNLLSSKADFVLCNYEYFSDHLIEKRNWGPEVGYVNKNSLYVRNSYCGCSGFIFKKTIANKYRFDEELGVSQDWDFLVRVMESERIYYTNKALIEYRIGQNESITQNYLIFSKDKINKKLKATIKNRNILGERFFCERAFNQIFTGKISPLDTIEKLKLTIKLIGMKNTFLVVVKKFLRKYKTKIKLG